MKVSTPEIDEAFAKVVEACGAVVSTQISSVLLSKRGVIAAAMAALAVSALGTVLLALGIRDFLVSAIPEQALILVPVLGSALILSAVGLICLFYCLNRD